MDCLPLLRIAARLLDLHDAERIPGNAPQFVQEDRRGRQDGQYVDIAACAMDVLRQHAHDSGNAFLGFDALRSGVEGGRGATEADDLRYVLNVLSRPTELWAIEREASDSRLVSDKASALVEKTYYADDYRLSSTGRTSIAVVSSIQSFAYVEGDALKLLRAIEAGDFDAVPAFCSALLDIVHAESIDLHLMLEKGVFGNRPGLYREQLPRYRKVVVQTSELLMLATRRLALWRESSGEDHLDDAVNVDLYELNQRVLAVFQALEAFGRKLGELTSLAANQRASVVEPPDFLAMALAVVRAAPTEAQLANLFRQFGPINIAQPYPSCRDVQGKVRIAPQRSGAALEFNVEGSQALRPKLRILFMEEHGPALRARLVLGPLPLSEAISNGWCRIAGRPAFGELLGAYLAPWLAADKEVIEVQVPAQMRAPEASQAGDLLMTDLELLLRGLETAA